MQKKDDSDKGHASTYSSRYFTKDIPKHKMPVQSMPANAVYQLIHDELNMDCNPALNLASFCTTWMEPEAQQIYKENVHKNFIDHDQYPQTEVIHKRCINMLAHLFNAPDDCKTIGSATIGSSEAIMLALLGHKWTWKKRREQEGKATDKPNIIFGADVHICWDKFAKYFDVEMRIIPMEKDCYVISAEKVKPLIDENTICVGAILGTTFTGQADPIEEINNLLLKVKKEKGWDIPVHVDGASGGFVTPFTQPDLLWDFRLEQVKSINVSGHKFGLVYPGLGWVLWKDEKDFPEDLIFHVNYLGGSMPTYTLNFSRNSVGIYGQYYNFLRLGKEGYTRIMNNCLENAQYLAKKLSELKEFHMINESQMLPIVAIRLTDDVKNYTVFDLSHKLRERGWVISAYTLPANAQDTAIMRIVVREHLSRDMVEILFADIQNAIKALETGQKTTGNGSSPRKGQHVC
ncbi:MAG: glutamate decarboxylase [Chlamydiales bacterium]|nr:glutamate decarboxylase [Chlamydiales bacterium]